MNTTATIKYTAYAASLVWSVATALAGWHFEGTVGKVLGSLPLIFVALFAIWDNWLWHRGPFLDLARIPDLRGTWVGKIESLWFTEDGTHGVEALPAILHIRQSFTSLSIRLITGNSSSRSTIFKIEHLHADDFIIHYQYENDPEVLLRSKLSAHAGSARLESLNNRPHRLTGEYWTNRLSKGALTFDWKSKTLVQGIDEARALPDISRSKEN